MERNVFLSSFMRSGSTHVGIGICRLAGLIPTILLDPISTGSDAHSLSSATTQVFARLSKASPQPYLWHHHSKATDGALEMLKFFSVKNNVVMIRRVADCLVSLREALSIPTGMPDMIVPDSWLSMGQEEQFMWLAHNATPWYLSFYVSWKQADIRKRIVHYEDFYADQVAGMTDLLDFIGAVSVNESHVREICAMKDSRFNVGVSGRGRSLMPKEAFDVIEAQAYSWGKKWRTSIETDLL